jgi:hypothetical protein
MRTLSRSRAYPDPGRLYVGLLRHAGAPKDVVDALERVLHETLNVLAIKAA